MGIDQGSEQVVGLCVELGRRDTEGRLSGSRQRRRLMAIPGAKVAFQEAQSRGANVSFGSIGAGPIVDMSAASSRQI